MSTYLNIVGLVEGALIVGGVTLAIACISATVMKQQILGWLQKRS